ncbi:DUF1080 domain-containing protein [Alistipes shahii]|uniref:DUF1080 domain-containing protein n=1 Tax=Alistipes shahii TaxID=328814 RepID=UPI0021A83774|nr:DUF1080 domain-containing protein [Alistipes shahii]UWN66986.1 DUF1080 domain-containing protein [Alistipes shahii WAL 8301]
MKKIFITILLAALMPFAAGAQDARQRTAETIVADALAQLPAQTPKAFDSLMQELAATGADGIRMMAAMLVPAAEGKNAPVEYAINGVVSYVTAAGREELAREIRAGLTDAVAASTDKPNQAFLLSQLQLCATAAEAPVFVKYAADEYLADYAVRGLISTPGTDGEILALIDASPAPDALLAYAAAEKRLAAAEPALLKWAADPKAGTPTKEAVYNALAKCGTAASIAPLAAAAKADGYAFTKTDATGAYVALLARLAAAGNSKAVAAAKALRKTGMPQNVRAAGLGIVLGTDAKKQTPELLAALKDADRAYRCAALDYANAFADEALYAALVKKLPSLSDAAQTDVVSWLGARHAASQSAAVVAAMSSPDDELALAAVRAAGKIGGQQALDALIAQLGGAHAKEASAALAAFNGKPNAAFVAALDGDPATQANALKLVAKRRITTAADKVFALLGSGDKAVRTAAYDALAGVTTAGDFDRLCDLLDKAQGDDVKALQAGLRNALAPAAPDMQYKLVAGRMAAAPQKARYYPLLAQAATDEAIGALLKADDPKAAFAALLTVKNPVMIDVLYELAGKNPDWTDAAISRYTDFATASDNTPMRKYQLYRKGLEANPSAKTQNKLLKALSRTPVFPALVLAVKYMDAPATAETAALVVKTVAAKNPGMGGQTVAAALKKALEVYVELAKADADAGYAVDEIKGLMAKLPEAGFEPLSLEPENRKAVVGNPETRKAMKPKALAKAQLEADAAMAQKWSLTDGILTAQANAPAIQFPKQYENFEMILDWKTPGEAGIAVRAIPQIRLGGVSGTGMLADDKGVADADNRPGNWNTLYVKVVDDRITVFENDVKIVENAVMTNPDMPGEPVGICGCIELIAGAAPVEFRNVYVNELPSTPVFELSAEEAAEGFEVLFDGRSLHKWTGNTTNYVPLNGTIDVTAQYGGSGNLYTKKEYSDFVLRFEFRFIREGVNNGIGIRTPMGVDAAFEGMEIQILDHDAPIYKDIKNYQQHGSVYGVIAAKRVKFPPLGDWNVEEIRAVGDRITVTVNGEVILDGNIREACQGHCVGDPGEKGNHYMIDHRNHPGLFNKSGHLGLLGHGAGIQFRNLRVLDLSASGRK